MASKKDSLSEKLDRVQKSIQQFPGVASSLNIATDQLGKSIAQLEAVLKKFSIGIPTWVSFNDSASADGLNYYHEDLGYAKIGGKWGIAVRTVQGDERSDHENIDQWPFGEAPRHLRVQATEVIPELLEGLLKGAAEMSKKMVDRAEEVDALTAGIDAVVNSVTTPRFQSAWEAKQHKATSSSVSVTQGSTSLQELAVGAISINVTQPPRESAGPKARK